MASDRILDLLRAPVDPDEVAEIRELWKVHSIAEDNRDLPAHLDTDRGLRLYRRRDGRPLGGS